MVSFSLEYSMTASLLKVPAHSKPATPAACTRQYEVAGNRRCSGTGCHFRGVRHNKSRQTVFQCEMCVVQEHFVR